MQTFILIRHGEYPNQFASGHFPNAALSEKGRRQAKLTGLRLAQAVPWARDYSLKHYEAG